MTQAHRPALPTAGPQLCGQQDPLLRMAESTCPWGCSPGRNVLSDHACFPPRRW